MIKRLFALFAFLAASAAAPSIASASCGATLPYTFTSTSPVIYTTTNANNNYLLSCVRNIDASQISGVGLYASQLNPTSMSQATFGGSQNYTFSRPINTSGITDSYGITTAGNLGVGAQITSASSVTTSSTVYNTETVGTLAVASSATTPVITSGTANTSFLNVTGGSGLNVSNITGNQIITGNDTTSGTVTGNALASTSGNVTLAGATVFSGSGNITFPLSAYARTTSTSTTGQLVPLYSPSGAGIGSQHRFLAQATTQGSSNCGSYNLPCATVNLAGGMTFASPSTFWCSKPVAYNSGAGDWETDNALVVKWASSGTISALYITGGFTGQAMTFECEGS